MVNSDQKRFLIMSSDRRVVDLIIATSAKDAMEVFIEDNDMNGSFTCITLSDDPFVEFKTEPDSTE